MQFAVNKATIAVCFPEFERIYSWLRPYTAYGRAEQPLIDNLRKVLDERKKGFSQFSGTDLVQLMLQQDADRQTQENVSLFFFCINTSQSDSSSGIIVETAIAFKAVFRKRH
jgi:hypothetical protein